MFWEAAQPFAIPACWPLLSTIPSPDGFTSLLFTTSLFILARQCHQSFLTISWLSCLLPSWSFLSSPLPDSAQCPAARLLAFATSHWQRVPGPVCLVLPQHPSSSATRHFSTSLFGQVLCSGFTCLLFFQVLIWKQSPPVYRRNSPTKDINQYLPHVLLKLSLEMWSIPFLSSQLSIFECDIPRANIRSVLWCSAQFYYYDKEELADNNVVLFSALTVLPHIGWTIPCSFFFLFLLSTQTCMSVHTYVQLQRWSVLVFAIRKARAGTSDLNFRRMMLDCLLWTDGCKQPAPFSALLLGMLKRRSTPYCSDLSAWRFVPRLVH